MISNKIVLLFFVACFVEKCSSTVEWREIFKRNDSNSDGLIDAVELQKIIFQDFKGFITVRLADIYISFINLNGSNKIGFEQFKRMAPLFEILSQRGNSEDNDKVNGSETISVENFQVKLLQKFGDVFKKKIEVLELFKLIGLNEKDSIGSEKSKEIVDILRATLKLNDLYGVFRLFDKDKNNVFDGEELVELIQKVRPDLAAVERAKAQMKSYDTNGNDEIDFAEFSNLYCSPLPAEQTFEDMFGKPLVSIDELNDFYERLLGGRLPLNLINQLDPLRKNKISYQDINKIANVF
ncbi:uncharacterized protein LOC126836334 [Adelges cooleyi]|uniref:uncharacterized protein LOC126836334 n=1 Tax=Adelges cooleyi TaxID=133065 RepID=UPI00217F74E0|nr:uncharacterized protein LOC126836334 [Adelges cooleyi]